MCAPVVGKPSAAQMAGFNGGPGTGVTITGYNPNFGVFQDAATQFASGLKQGVSVHSGFQDQGGTFNLSDGTTQSSASVISQNQTNAFGAPLDNPANFGKGTQALGKGVTAESFVGKELTAPAPPPQSSSPAPPPAAPTPAAASSPAPVTSSSSGGGGGGGGTNTVTTIEKKVTKPKVQTFDEESSGGRRGRSRNRKLRAGGGSTLITGGEGVSASGNTTSKTLFGE